MALYINHNMMAANAARNLGIVYDRLSTSTQRLSSGLRINSAADDAAGLAIRELMRADIAVLNQGLRNAADSISLIQTAEGALSVIDEKLIRMKELAEQAATGTYTTVQREIMDSEYQAMAAEIDRIANATDFNGIKLLDGSLSTLHSGSGLKVHFGAGNDEDEDYYFISIQDSRATSTSGLQIGGGATQDIWTAQSGQASLTTALTTRQNEYVGFWYNAYGTSSATGISNTPSNLVGFYNAASGAGLTALVNQINQGTASRIALEFAGSQGNEIFGAGCGSATTFQQIQVGNTNISFYTTCAASAAINGGDVFVRTSAGAFGGSALASLVAQAHNNYTSADTFAVVVDANTLLFFAKTAGVGGNTLTFSEVGGNSTDYSWTDLSTGTVMANAGNFSMGGLNWVQADTSNDGTAYHMQLSGADRGAYRDVQMLRINDQVVNSATWADELDDFSSGSAAGTVGWEQSQNATGAGSWNGADILTQSNAQEALAQLDAAILNKDKVRAGLGALQNRLENTITNLSIQAENLQASESRISDVDVALEMTEFTRNNIMAQAATAMLAQANSLAQLALSLLG
ncbi:MAG: flagellin [Proteobacteria bacterium]|nr:flagellin [Pseudomonadota bacterium]